MAKRNEFHTKENWINDPNGLCYFNGFFHIYYQYNPCGNKWGNIAWGHAITKNFISYKEEKIAIDRNKIYDKDGCFSGSSIVKNHTIYAYYTSVSNGKQTQSVAYSDDGYNYIKYANNPIIETNFEARDPYIFMYDSELYMLLGAQNKVLLYKGKDMFNFEFVSTIYELEDFPECPNILFLNGKCVLKYSSITDRCDHFLIGAFDCKKFILEKEEKLDLPKNFYASQAFKHKNKYILIGWIYNDNYETIEKYNGKLSIPYVIDYKNDKLVLINY